MQNNLEAYVHGQINASSRRVLFTKRVGQAWEQVSTYKAMVVRSFKKFGIAVAVDGSEDNEIYIEGLPCYRDEGSDVDDDDDDDDDIVCTSDEKHNPFAGCNDTDDEIR